MMKSLFRGCLPVLLVYLCVSLGFGIWDFSRNGNMGSAFAAFLTWPIALGLYVIFNFF